MAAENFAFEGNTALPFGWRGAVRVDRLARTMHQRCIAGGGWLDHHTSRLLASKMPGHVWVPVCQYSSIIYIVASYLFRRLPGKAHHTRLKQECASALLFRLCIRVTSVKRFLFLYLLPIRRLCVINVCPSPQLDVRGPEPSRYRPWYDRFYANRRHCPNPGVEGAGGSTKCCRCGVRTVGK